jgi:hypothetical protein
MVNRKFFCEEKKEQAEVRKEAAQILNGAGGRI